MKRTLFVLFFVASLSCGGKEDTSAGDPTGDFLREVTAAAREKPRIQVMVRASAEEPTAEDLVLRRSIEDRIEQERIGRLISSGAGGGFIEVTLEVENTAEAISQIRRILQSLEVLNRASFKVVPPRNDS